MSFNHLITTPVNALSPRRAYQTKTLFKGNGRKLLWEGLGSDVSGASSSREVLQMAGLDYRVETEPIFTADGRQISNMVCTRRYDGFVPSTVYGAVTERYQPVQNTEGFEFLDALYQHQGFAIETAGQFDDGKIVWIEARLPRREMTGEQIDPYIVFTNRHDGKGSVRVFLSPVRVICKNTLNLAIRKAKGRTFAVRHTSTAMRKLEAAKETLNNYSLYLDAMDSKIADQKRVLLTDNKLTFCINTLLPLKDGSSDRQKERILADRQELRSFYDYAPDLDGYEKSAFRFVNAVSDWATHRTPARQTRNYRGNLFQNTLNGNEYIDAAFRIVDEMDVTKTIAVNN